VSGRQPTMVAILGIILAACGAGMEPTPPPPVSPPPSHGPSSLATATTAPTAVVPSATPVPTPTPTPRPAPPKPTGVRYEWESFEFCDDPSNPEFLCEVAGNKHTLRWKAPRTKGVQIRVYAVTECLSNDSSGAVIDGWCLRDRTANDMWGEVDASVTRPFDHSTAPASTVVLVAKGPAAKGRLTWKSPVDLLGYDEGDAWNSAEVYSIVVAAFDKAGQHSPFAVADSTHLCDLIDSMECPEDSYWPPGDGE
jgi:hypothetical protein